MLHGMLTVNMHMQCNILTCIHSVLVFMCSGMATA